MAKKNVVEQMAADAKARHQDGVTAEVKDGCLIVKIPLLSPPQPSQSGKTLVVASTRGNIKTNVSVKGKPVTIGVNAYIQKG